MKLCFETEKTVDVDTLNDIKRLSECDLSNYNAITAYLQNK